MLSRNLSLLNHFTILFKIPCLQPIALLVDFGFVANLFINIPGGILGRDKVESFNQSVFHTFSS